MHPSFTLEIGNEYFSGHELIEAVQKNHLVFDEEWQMSVVLFLQQWFNEGDDILVQTSGSTGKPQVIHLSKSKMRVSAEMTCDYFGLKPLDRALLCLSAENIAGKMMLVRAIERGLHLIADNPVGCPLSAINERVRFSAMVPLQVQHCLERKCLDKTEILLIGGVAISDKMQEELLEQPVDCYISYGMTETMSHVALKKLNGVEASEWFERLADISFSLDERGCLQIEAISLGVEKLQTNDLCELQGNHRFRWLGRLDFIINSGGVKVSPEQLEKILSPYILFPFFITGIPNEELGEQVVIFVEAPSAEQIPVYQIQQLILEWPKYQRPKDIYFLPEFAYTSSGKINRNATKTKKRYCVS
jgi:O-succinylbenzoic acid--CoA ligase